MRRGGEVKIRALLRHEHGSKTVTPWFTPKPFFTPRFFLACFQNLWRRQSLLSCQLSPWDASLASSVASCAALSSTALSSIHLQIHDAADADARQLHDDEYESTMQLRDECSCLAVSIICAVGHIPFRASRMQRMAAGTSLACGSVEAARASSPLAPATRWHAASMVRTQA